MIRLSPSFFRDDFSKGGVRVGAGETAFFGSLKGAKVREFKEISRLVKCDAEKDFFCPWQ